MMNLAQDHADRCGGRSERIDFVNISAGHELHDALGGFRFDFADASSACVMNRKAIPAQAPTRVFAPHRFSASSDIGAGLTSSSTQVLPTSSMKTSVRGNSVGGASLERCPRVDTPAVANCGERSGWLDRS